MANWDPRPLFIAIPELSYNVDLAQTLLDRGFISEEQFNRIKLERAAAKKLGKVVDTTLNGEGIIGRLLAVSSEIMSGTTVDVLYASGLISKTQNHALRIALTTFSTATQGGLPSDLGQIFTRLYRVLGVQVSTQRIDLWQSLGYISAGDAERWRGYLRTGRGVQESLAKAVRAKSMLDALMLIGDIPMKKSVISGMVSSGILSPKQAEAYNAFIDLGVKQWKVFAGTKIADGYRSRLLLALTGSMNRELLDFLLRTKVITPSQWAGLQILEIASRNLNDRMLEKLTARRYRVRPNERPIKTFARASRKSDQDLLQLLAQAANEAGKEAEALAQLGKAGARTRSAQYRLAAKGLHEQMRFMWEGVGYLTIRGEKEVAEAALESTYALKKAYGKLLPQQLLDSIYAQSNAGVDSYISREENTYALSRRIYKNIALYEGAVDQRIALALLKGQGPAELAADIRKYISPRVPGGVSYAAMRLGRTEINNAFHQSTIRFTREMPWVTGYKWNLSGSHGKPDICNDYAEQTHGLPDSPGVFKKAEVPGKPHPHCLCYITVTEMDERQFIYAYRAGRFNSYLKDAERGSALSDTNFDPASRQALARAVGTQATQFAASAPGASLLNTAVTLARQ